MHSRFCYLTQLNNQWKKVVYAILVRTTVYGLTELSQEIDIHTIYIDTIDIHKSILRVTLSRSVNVNTEMR